MNANLRIQNEIGPHDAADGAGGTDEGQRRGLVGEHMTQRGEHSTHEIKRNESTVTHGVLDVISENPEEPHVADEV